uniref:Lactamase, beta n=1 Tax=Cyprinus carpio TaxID=7962 RepID=A0A8C1VU15_CYPCA
MCRLLCLSRGLVGTQCKYSVQKSEPFASLLTSRAKLRDQLMKRLISTSRRPVLTSHNYRLPLFWLLGIGTGFVIYICIHTHAHTTLYIRDEVGAPGMVIGVSVDGSHVWCEGVGYADLENRVPCGPDAVMRIASINLDAPVQKYVPEFPQKQYEGEDLTIIYILSCRSKPDFSCELKTRCSAEYLSWTGMFLCSNLSLTLCCMTAVGSVFLYSTHAYTLLSAVVERAAGQRFLDHMMKMFQELGMLNTVPDENDPIIYNRSRFYHFNKKGCVVNCPYVDNSYKWAGGGFLSTVGDLLVFGNALLYSYQMAGLKNTDGLLPGFLKPHTAKAMWAPVDKTEASWDKNRLYAQGWLVVEKQQKYGRVPQPQTLGLTHRGVGASSVLLVLPSESGHTTNQMQLPPRGVVVTIITNMQSVGLNTTVLKIVQEFDKARDEETAST